MKNEINIDMLKLPLAKEVVATIEKTYNIYGNVIRVEASYEGASYIESIFIDFAVNSLCQYWVNKIEKIEPIAIRIQEGTMPEVIVLRDEFPIVPHLNIYDSGIMSLCLFDVSYEDIKFKLNANLLLQRIEYWFSKTARGELHQIDQPLEPFFQGVENLLIMNYKSFEYLFCQFKQIIWGSRKIFLQVTPGQFDPDATTFAIFPILIAKINSDNIMKTLPQTLFQLDSLFPDAQIIPQLKKCAKEIYAIKKQSKIYDILFKQTESKLLRSQCLIFLQIPLCRQGESHTERHDIKAFLLNQNLSDIIIDLDLQRVKSNLVECNTKSALGKNITLSHFNVHSLLDAEYAQRLNGYDSIDCLPTIVQIGVGSLGSQLAENCIKSGYGRWTFIDDDILLPHNLARHALSMPFITQNKAFSMCAMAHGILINPDVDYIDCNIFDSANKLRIIDKITDSDIVIDTSASPAVERYIALELSTKNRCVSFFMNPKGDCGIMLMESANRSETLDLLEMQYYKILANNDKMEDHLSIPDNVIYSTNCRSASGKMPQDNVSLFSALCSKALKKYIKKESSQIIIWTTRDSIVDTFIVSGENYYLHKADEWKVFIIQSVVGEMKKKRIEKLPLETGGVLIGTYDCTRKIAYIVDLVDSPIDSIESPTSYIRGCKGLYSRVTNIERKTAGNITYVGEWHSHPNNNTCKSQDDKKLLESISDYNANHCIPACMIIVGGDSYSVYLRKFNYS